MIPRRIAVWGTGSIGLRHLRLLGEIEGVEVAACPVRPGGGDRPELASVRRLDGLAGLRDFAPEAVVIATDTSRHVDDALAALDLGAHVLVEKPVAATADRVDEIGEAAGRAGRRVHVACNLRFTLGLAAVAAHRAEVGEPFAMRVECQSYLPSWRPGTDYRQGYAARPDEGGVLRDLVHEVDYSCWLLGAPGEVYAVLGHDRRIGLDSDESADLLWRAPGGVSVSLRLDYLARHTRRQLTLFGDRGELHWDAIAQRVSLRLIDQPERVLDVSQARDDTMRDQARAWLRAIDGEPAPDPHRPPLATLADGIAAVRLLDAARRSHASGAREPIAPSRVTP